MIAGAAPDYLSLHVFGTSLISSYEKYYRAIRRVQ